MREREVEKALTKEVKKRGGIAFKFVSPGMAGVPDRLILMKDGKLLRFSSVEDGLREAASKLHTNYLSKGGKFYFGKTLAAVKTRFCPESSTWVNLVFGRMKQIIK